MLQTVIDFLKTCPFLDGVLLTADFLGDEDGCFGIETVATNPVIELYADGGSLRQFVFRILYRVNHHAPGETAPADLYEKIAGWIEQTTKMPVLDKGKTAQRFEILKTGTVSDRKFGSLQYCMECRMIYYAEKGSEV
ncbi:MAG: hypothetical protein IJF61_04675 [Clostridia bacterium]|nr:hypothetical protein [Clostridia bacterium]